MRATKRTARSTSRGSSTVATANGDFEPAVLQLVGLAEILAIDPGIAELAELPIGCRATRKAPGKSWMIGSAEE